MTSYNQFINVKSNIGTKLKSLPNHIGLIEYIINELLHLHQPDFLSGYPRLVIIWVYQTCPVPFLSVLKLRVVASSIMVVNTKDNVPVRCQITTALRLESSTAGQAMGIYYGDQALSL